MKNASVKGILLSVALPSIVTAFIIGIFGVMSWQSGLGIFEFVALTWDKFYTSILITYIIVLPACFPLVVSIFKKENIVLQKQVTSPAKIKGDLLFGGLAAICSYIFFYVDVHVLLKMPVEKTENVSLALLEMVSLVMVSGVFKEIYFRGVPYILLRPKIGEWKAFLIGNLWFAVLDWPNLGLSFFIGLIWYLFYRKRGSLLVPIIGHGVFNLFGIFARSGVLGFIGIVPS